MAQPERRTLRSNSAYGAAQLLLETVRIRIGSSALALTTHDGLLVAGAGRNVDLEGIGAIGASCHKAQVNWGGHALQISSFVVNGARLFVTAAGAKSPIPSMEPDLARILR